MILETVLIIIVVILFLVVSHELGHFLVAKWFNVRVDEFGIGLPPRIFGKRFGETLYSLNLLPFGGFVRIFGEEGEVSDPRSFSSQTYKVKSLIVAAGVIANVIMGFILLSFLAWFGTPQFAVEVSQIAPGSPAESAGFQAGDIIVGLGGVEKIPLDVSEVQRYIGEHKGKEAVFLVKRGKETLAITGNPRISPPPGEGALGVAIGPKEVGIKRAPWYLAPWEGAKMTFNLLLLLIIGFGYFFSQLFTTGGVPGEIIGPVGIASVARESFFLGITFFIQLMALLSLNLAVINILPIPALDGGRLFFFIIEKIKGKPIPARISQFVHSFFLLLLIFLLLLVTYRDIIRSI